LKHTRRVSGHARSNLPEIMGLCHLQYSVLCTQYKEPETAASLHGPAASWVTSQRGAWAAEHPLNPIRWASLVASAVVAVTRFCAGAIGATFFVSFAACP
jgi:hypothetical protein